MAVPRTPPGDAFEGSPDRSPDREPPSTRQEELRSFLFFTIVMAPVLAVLFVASAPAS